MVPLLVVPVLLGAAWSLVVFTVLSLLCFREFARATGLFREKLMSLLVVIGILSLTFAVADHWYRLFVALTPMNIVVITAVATSQDRPKGYIQRVALAIFGFMLFGTCLGHLSYMTNDTHYRSLVLLLIFCVQLNDVFAYIVGKSLGGPKLAPQTSPNKTISGALGAVVLTTLLVYWLSGIVFTEGPLAEPLQRWSWAYSSASAGQLGDLTVSVDQAGRGHQGHGSSHSRPWRRARPGQQPASVGTGHVSLRQSFPADRTGPGDQSVRRRGMIMEPWTFKPASDIELSPVERARSLRRESGLFSTAGHLAWQLSTKAFFKLYHRLSVEAEQSVPAQPPFVMIANHTSHLDALLLAAALPCRLCDCVFPVAAGDVFFNTPADFAVLGHALECAADVAEELRSARPGRAEKAAHRRAVRPDPVSRGNTQSRRNARPVQAGAGHAHGRHDRSRHPLSFERSISCVSTRGPAAPTQEDPAQDRPASRFRLGAQSPRRLGRDRHAYPGGCPAARQCRPRRNGCQRGTAR